MDAGEAEEMQRGPGVNGDDEKNLLHILVVPAQSEGHLNGMRRLAQALVAEERVVVTFGYPARFFNLAKKRSKLFALLSPAHSTSMLRVEVIEDGLPLGDEHVLTHQLLRTSMPVYQSSVKLLLDDLLHKCKRNSAPLPPLSCIISDTFMPWMQDLADAVGLPRVDFWTSTAAVYSMGSQLSLLVSNGILPLPESCWVDLEKKWTVEAPLIDCIPGLPPLRATDLPVEFLEPKEPGHRLKFMMASFGRIREAHTILVNSVYELESQVFDALQANGFHIHAVGPLPDTLSKPSTSTHVDSGNHECLKWLDTQLPASVIYVALGSVASLPPTEMHSLALGLEASGYPFLWVIRRDSISLSLSDDLPEGFLQRTVEKGSGLIVSWSPQTEVLCHCAVGAFFSHCGWNSTLECLWEGVPMVACPREAEQRSNARWIVENWKIGVEVERQQGGSFTKEGVLTALQSVMAPKGKESTDYKERALHAKQIARSAVQKGGTSHSNLVGFLHGLRT